ncbi:MAG TPA: Nif3-like dinuclear metal center hexameric protein [Gemmatimonadaceae bacterium]|jgi:dinuclear metal center YbgI/SA1388 family protein|nr:Nif3-like dinuclear metal center hexameric protein [Gemmatimonadaceae bacterium]
MTTPASCAPLTKIAEHLDDLLRTKEVPDYPGAMNGVQVEHIGPVTRCAVAVDASLRTIDAAIESGATLLLVHHGLFWGGAQPLRGRVFERIRRLIANDLAVYSSHLPLDLHPEIGNNALLARELRVTPTAGFASFQGVSIGVMGEADVETSELASRCAAIANREGGHLVATPTEPGRRTRRWAICTGAGASSDTLQEAAAAGVDTMIVGEGPHHTAVDAPELGIAILYAGHYATETFGVRALGQEVERAFGIPWSFIDAPSGL